MDATTKSHILQIVDKQISRVESTLRIAPIGKKYTRMELYSELRAMRTVRLHIELEFSR